MENATYLHSYCHLKNGKAVLNGKEIFSQNQASINEFLKSFYQFLQLDYPKFFKMDELCKLAFIGAELVFSYEKNEHLVKENDTEETQTAVILANASSTLETDKKHQESIKNEMDYFPSPSVFVYTLPNITIGEITIRHKLKGENTFFVTEKYDTSFMRQYVNSLLENNLAKAVLTGWVEYGSNGYEAFIYLVGKQEKGLAIEHFSENVDKLYNSPILFSI